MVNVDPDADDRVTFVLLGALKGCQDFGAGPTDLGVTNVSK